LTFRPHATDGVASLTGQDRAQLEWLFDDPKLGPDLLALSFVKEPEDASVLRQLVTGRTQSPYSPLIIAKIETARAVETREKIADIIAAFDGVMVARGDLGPEKTLELVPSLQKTIITEAKRLAKPVIVATQMLLSMTESTRPTRAEVSDVANAVYDGADALMLSDETATGKHPIVAVTAMSNIIKQAENDIAAGTVASHLVGVTAVWNQEN